MFLTQYAPSQLFTQGHLYYLVLCLTFLAVSHKDKDVKTKWRQEMHNKLHYLTISSKKGLSTLLMLNLDFEFQDSCMETRTELKKDIGIGMK